MIDRKIPPFQQLQRALAADVRAEAGPPAVCYESSPDARRENERLGVYRQLLFNNLKSLLDSAFPICRQLSGEDNWSRLVRSFFVDYQHRTPLFPQIAAEFLEYLQQAVGQGGIELADFLLELAHYEWLELAIDIDETELEGVQLDEAGDVWAEVPLLAPVCEGFLYRYPVHLIGLQNARPEPQTTALIVYRNPQDLVCFTETNPLTLGLLALLKGNQAPGSMARLSGRQLVGQLLRQQALPENPAALDGGRDILLQWRKSGIIWGTIGTASDISQ